MQILHGHTSEETAYKVENYPYGGLRTTMFYWIETVKGKGDRFCSMTINPKNGRKNNPKKSTYSDFMYLYIEPVTGHVKHNVIAVYHLEQFPQDVKFIAENCNPSELQKEHLRNEYMGHLKVSMIYYWVKEYPEEQRPEFMRWVKDTLTHIKEEKFECICEYEPKPEIKTVV